MEKRRASDPALLLSETAEPCSVLLDSAHGTCRLVSTRRFDPAATPAAPFCPDLRVLPDSAAHAAVDTCWYVDSGPAGMRWEDSGVRLRVPWSDTDKGAEVGYVAAALMERDRQRRGYFTVPAASAALGRRGILLLGRSGAGKTSVLSRLCRHHGAEFIGNDLTVLGGPGPCFDIVAGNRFLSLRQESVTKSMDGLGMPGPHRKGIDAWRTKWRVEPADAGMSVSAGPRSLGHAFLVHVDETQVGIHAERDHDMETLLFLHENAARYIRGTAVHAFNGKLRIPIGYVPSLDTEEFYNHRARVIQHIVNDCGIRYVSGPSVAVAEYIAAAVH